MTKDTRKQVLVLQVCRDIAKNNFKIFILNIFSGIITFEYEKSNAIIIASCCLLNCIIAIKSATTAVKNP